MNDFPPMTKDLARRLERVLFTHSVESMLHVQTMPGNPYGVEIARFGPATAYVAAAAGAGWWNRAAGLESGDPAALDAMLAFFAGHGVPPNIDLEPGVFTTELGRGLAARGLRLNYVDTVVYGVPRASQAPLPPGVTVDEVSKGKIDLVLDLWAEGFEVSGPDRQRMQDIRRGAFIALDNHLYIASVDGTPAAMAALLIKEGVGYLNVGATLPPYRQRGCHSALTQRRIAEAAAAGCDLLMGFTAGFGRASQTNMERRGMRVAYNRLSWTG